MHRSDQIPLSTAEIGERSWTSVANAKPGSREATNGYESERLIPSVASSILVRRTERHAAAAPTLNEIRPHAHIDVTRDLVVVPRRSGLARLKLRFRL